MCPTHPMDLQGKKSHGQASDDSDAGGSFGPCRGPLYAEALNRGGKRNLHGECFGMTSG